MAYPAGKHALATLGHLVNLMPAKEKIKTQVLLLAGGITDYRNDTDREQTFRQESNFNYLSGCHVPGSLVLYTAIPVEGNSDLFDHVQSTLFIPPITPADVMWSVPPPTLAEAAKIHDFSDIQHVAALSNVIKRILKAHPEAIFHTLSRNSLQFPEIPTEYADLVIQAGNEWTESSGGPIVTDAWLLYALHRARIIKDKEEIELIRKACAISSRAHETVMRVLGKAVREGLKSQPSESSQSARSKNAGGQSRPPLPGEWLIEKEAEAEAVFVASCRREGATHQAYLPIMAASTRAATLHYCCNDREFSWGPVAAGAEKNDQSFQHSHTDAGCSTADHSNEKIDAQVLLIDAGCEWSCYASDITRTMPVGNGGRFTPEARAIYEIVLDMQKLSLDALKPDLHWDEIHLICHRTLIRGFQNLGIFKTPESPGSGSWNSEEAILASGVSAAFFPHGVGHSLGMDVHDCVSASKPKDNTTLGGDRSAMGPDSLYDYLRLRIPIKAGMVVTVEPGIYFSTHLMAPVRDSKHIDHAVLARYESVGGIRIEDVVLIDQEGCENLTRVQSETAWIEGVCSGEL